MASSRQKMTRDTIPEDFTLSLALVDALPVILFGVNCILIGRLLGSPLFVVGAVLCLLGGGGKVLWKIIVALKKKNIWFLFVQMRILMPVGFLLMLAALIGAHSRLHPAALLTAVPSLVCFGLGLLGMVLMGVFAAALDNSDLRSNWIEQLTNAAGQLCILVGLILL